jgi:RNA polymerase sigma-B factor
MTRNAEEPSLASRLDGKPRPQRTQLRLQAAAAATSDQERQELHDQVIRDNLVVAAQIAARYRNRGIPDEDLKQVAYLALVKAVRRYEYAPDRDFLSYAVPTIRGELKRCFRDLGWTIRPPRSIQEAQQRILRAEGELFQELGRPPRPSEIAAHLELDLDVVVEAMSVNGCFQPASLDAAAPDGGATLGDNLGHEESGFVSLEARVLLQPLLEHLSDRERTMLEMRFVRGATQQEIGDALGITQMQVSRLLSALMIRLRDQLDAQKSSHTPDQHSA